MAKTLVFLVLVLFSSISVFQVNGCNIDAIGGGCPDATACQQTCGGCFRGIGRVIGSCIAPGAGVYWWICRCDFEDGAPCPPTGSPKCPSPPALAAHAPLVHPPAPAITDRRIKV